MTEQLVNILNAISLLKSPLSKQPILTFKNNLVVFRQLNADEKKTVKTCVEYMEEILKIIETLHWSIKELYTVLKKDPSFRLFIQDYNSTINDELSRSERLVRFCNPEDCKKTMRTISLLMRSAFSQLEQSLLLSKIVFIGIGSSGRSLEKVADGIRAIIIYLTETFKGLEEI